MNAGGGVWTLQDLADYGVIERQPTSFTYRDARITCAALPSSGGLVLAQALQILERFALRTLSPVDRDHLVVEALRRGYQDRARYLGDPGFVPALPSRSELPDVAVATDERTVHGRIDMFPKPALRLAGRDDGEDRAVRVLSFPDAEDLERVLGMPVAPYQILLDAAEPDGFVRAWAPSGVGAERNLAYAGQWFALSVATLVAALVWLLKSRVRERGR